jgi:hypothetical protein
MYTVQEWMHHKFHTRPPKGLANQFAVTKQRLILTFGPIHWIVRAFLPYSEYLFFILTPL